MQKFENDAPRPFVHPCLSQMRLRVRTGEPSATNPSSGPETFSSTICYNSLPDFERACEQFKQRKQLLHPNIIRFVDFTPNAT